MLDSLPLEVGACQATDDARGNGLENATVWPTGIPIFQTPKKVK
jgi:hypothetical protein